MSARHQYGLVTQTGLVLPVQEGVDVQDAIKRADRTGYQLVFRTLGTWLPLFPDTPSDLTEPASPDANRLAPQGERHG